MRVGYLAVSLLGLPACGAEPRRRVKTPAERLQEQETIAYQRELERRQKSDPSGLGEFEPGDTFDARGLELQLKQAALSAQTCAEVVTGEEEPLGEAVVTLGFVPDGSQASLSISPPFEGTRMGSCVLNAFREIRAAPYSGDAPPVAWSVQLER